MAETNNGKPTSQSDFSRSSGSSLEDDVFHSAAESYGDSFESCFVPESTEGGADAANADLRESIASTASASSSGVASVDPADGEYHQLINSVEDDSPPLTQMVEAALKRELSQKDLTKVAWYGHQLSVEDATVQLPPGHGGLVWHATIIPDDFIVNGKLKRGLNHGDFDLDNGNIKPRRPSLPLTASSFLASLTKIKGAAGPAARYIFHGILNGWPGLRTMELISLEYRRNSSALPSPRDLLTGQILWVKAWSAEDDGSRGVDPKIVDSHRIYRAKLRSAPWSSMGWSKENPGFCFWFEAQRKQGPRVSFGTKMLTDISNEPKCTRVHMISHRYAVHRVETARDRITYHSICLLEWDHGEYCTVIEAAYLNGMGGYRGMSNWYDDRDQSVTGLYLALPLEMISPWRTTQSEIRCYDVPAKSLEEFRRYMIKYEGTSGRFLDIRFTFSHAARLTFRSKSHIAQYLLNYSMRDSSYAELKRNCQTFTADLCSFLAGKKGIAPFHPVSRIEYQNRTYLFLYDSHLYEKKNNKK